MKYTSVPGQPYTVNNMAQHNVSPKGPNVSGAPMDRMKKLLSPSMKRKQVQSKNKTFGTSLDVLVKRNADGNIVPIIVEKTCEFISRHGMKQEGIFRINGNARVLEKLRYDFDQQGDVDIDEECDVMAVAGLLKLFLRELPDTVIPENMTQDFVSLQEASRDVSVVVEQLKKVLERLPEENFNLLKFLCQFLVVVSHHEKDNKMSPMALSIVFGPNLFKCGEGIAGLRDQGITNQIVFKFITQYETLFQLPQDESPLQVWEKRYKKTPPPRPPPPKLAATTAEDSLNLLSPRNLSEVSYDSSQYQDSEMDQSDVSLITAQVGGARSGHAHFTGLHGPYQHEDYPDRSPSPFITESEGHSIIESPVITARTHELVEKTIAQSITQHIFGDRFSVSPEKDSSHSNSTASDGNLASLPSDNSERSESEPGPPVRERIQKFEGVDMMDETDSTQLRPTKQRPSSDVFDFFENKGIIISQAPPATELKESTPESDSSELGGVERSTEVLSSFKKPSGPVRRSPSRKFRRSLESAELAEQVKELLEDDGMVVVTPDESEPQPLPRPQPAPRKQTLKQKQMSSSSSSSEEEEEDSNQNNQSLSKPQSRIAFLDIREEDPVKSFQVVSPDRSPLNNRKPFVPPLDLTILHEHVDSSDPIPARTTQSTNYMMRKPCPQEPSEDLENTVIVSPRSSKLKKKNGWMSNEDQHSKFEAPPSPSARNSFLDERCVAVNTDIPPSPPVEQDQYKKHGPEDESSQKLRQLTKRIQLLKKRIKAFDENFEKEHGYRPSHHDKAAQPEIKKYMSELSRARKELKKLREEAEMGSRSRHGSGASSSGERTDVIPTLPPTIEDTLEIILKNLQEKRRDVRRPREISMMNYEQVLDEKLAVQKSLLHFESIHGRPSTRGEKDLMRPLYDRYRSIKRILAKPSSPRNTIDLETVPEDQEITTGPTNTMKFRNPIRVPTADPDDGDIGTMEFAVTRDFSILRETGRHAGLNKNKSVSSRQRNDSDEEDELIKPDFHVNDMSIPELQDELQRAKSDKKRLRKVLRTFEEDFLCQHGRRVQKEDRSPLQGEYSQYKQIKAKLRLLEALLNKYHTTDRV